MRPEKELLKNEIKSKFDQHDSFVVVNYTKFSANAANSFRRQLKKLGGELEVVRKRVLVKAAEDAGISLDDSFLTGHVGLVFLGNDPIETTKVVFAFANEGEKTMDVVGGQFDGKIYGGVDVKRLSELPGKDEMRAQLLSVLEAPLSNTLSVMVALMTSVPYCLDNKVKLEAGE